MAITVTVTGFEKDVETQYGPADKLSYTNSAGQPLFRFMKVGGEVSNKARAILAEEPSKVDLKFTQNESGKNILADIGAAGSLNTPNVGGYGAKKTFTKGGGPTRPTGEENISIVLGAIFHDVAAMVGTKSIGYDDFEKTVTELYLMRERLKTELPEMVSKAKKTATYEVKTDEEPF